jgi:hypothetical protein
MKHDSSSSIEYLFYVLFYVCFHSKSSLRNEDFTVCVFQKMLVKSGIIRLPMENEHEEQQVHMSRIP